MDNLQFQDRLKALRQCYLDQLPEKVRQVRLVWEARAEGSAVDRLNGMRQMVHSLAGSGATFGCQDVGPVAERLEMLLRIVLAQTIPISASQQNQISDELDALDAVLLQCSTRWNSNAASGQMPEVMLSGQTAGSSGKVLFLLEDDAEFARQFAARLAQYGYQVQVLSEIAGFRAALEKSPPLALVMGTALPDCKLGGAEFASRLREQTRQIIPVIFLGTGGDFEARLAAVRAGATHYLDKSLDVSRLVQILGDLSGSQAGNRYRVMIVDDDTLLADLYRLYLEEAGMTVVVVNDPLAAMGVLKQFGPDIVLMDIHMSRCNGLELAAVMRQHESFDHIPIVFLSAEWKTDRMLAAMNLGNDDFLTKPVVPWHLVSSVMARIKRSRILRRDAMEVQQVLRELEQFKSALDQHAIVSMADADGTITYVNEKFCEISGYDRTELIGKNHRIVKSGTHPQDFYDQMWVTIASGKVWHGEVKNRKKDGDCYWVETTIVPFLDKLGVSQRYISIRTDITVLKETETALRQSDDRLRRSQVYANIGTWDWNIQSGGLYWSERIAPLFGYPEGTLETTYENFLNAVHPDDRQKVIDAVGAAVSHDARYDIEHRCVWPDGSVHWISERGAVVRAPDGKPLNMLGVVQDVTERKLAEQALHTSGKRLREAQRIAHLGHWTWDVASGEITWSDEIYRIFGREPGEFKPTYERFLAVLHPEDVERIKHSEREAFGRGEKHSIDHRIILPGGEVRWVHEEAQATVNAAGEPVALSGTVQDITRRKLAEDDLVEARDEAERANRAKSDFLSSMSHELRTPMNAILGFGQLLESDSTEPLTQSQKESVDQILRAGWHLLDLINEVLDLAKVESGKIDLSIENVNPLMVLRECVDLMSGVAANSGIQVSLDISPGAVHLVRADHTRLKQALLNLISNAIKYNRNNGMVTISSRYLGGGRLRLCVSDSGVGLSEEQQQRLFQPFNRLGAEHGVVEGSGIGLVITRRIVELMGGVIGVESELGQGSTFWVELDVVDEHAGLSEKEIARDMPELHGTSKRTVLYIEDNPANLRLVAQLLGRLPSIKLLSAHTGELGMELARNDSLDLIILDINLQGMDGYKVCSRLRLYEQTKHVPVIVLSANAMPQDVECGLKAGFDRHLTKPLNVIEFMKALNELMPDSAGTRHKKMREGRHSDGH